MAWIVAGILALIVVLMWFLYQRAIDEGRGTASLMAMVLMDDTVRDAQQKGLVDFILATPAKNAGELGLKVNLSITNMGYRISPSILLGAPGLMWKIKQEGDKAITRRPAFVVHYEGGEIEKIRILPHDVEKWAASAQEEGEEIEAICDDHGYVIWPEKDGSRIL